jgi:hypothetical protein
MTVELGSVTLQHLTRVDVSEAMRVVRHPVPGLSGDLSQVLGRPSVTVRLQGIFYGAEAPTELEALRTAHLASEPLDFFTEAVGEGYFAQVLITRLQVAQRAGYPDQFDFACEVVEYVEPPEPAVSGPGGLGLFDALDAGLLDEAAGFLDDVQNALAEVSSLVDLIANAPSFGDPTTQLPQLLDAFEGLTQGGIPALTAIRDSF